MQIDHIAIWCKDIEVMKDFYETYFLAESDELDGNQKVNNRTCYLSFPKSSTKIKLINNPSIKEINDGENLGYAYVSFRLDTRHAVDELTSIVTSAGFGLIKEPHVNEYNYYESTILDPEGNVVKICYY